MQVPACIQQVHSQLCRIYAAMLAEILEDDDSDLFRELEDLKAKFGVETTIEVQFADSAEMCFELTATSHQGFIDFARKLEREVIVSSSRHNQITSFLKTIRNSIKEFYPVVVVYDTPRFKPKHEVWEITARDHELFKGSLICLD